VRAGRAIGAKLVLLLTAAACSGGGDARKQPDAPESSGGRGAAPVESTTAAPAPATGKEPGAPLPDRAGAPRVLFVGTSLTAGYGLVDPGTDAFPAVLQRMADSAGIRANIVNAGLSGETSAGALRRAEWLLREKPDVVVIETGANDGLRGLDPDSTAANIRALVERVRAANPTARILLTQMEAPTNLGQQYTRRFHALFPKVAADEKITLLPFVLDGVAGVAHLNQADGIHPTPEGARLAAKNLWPGLARALKP
jgi:acyl-CoA thioesterase-1